MPGLFGVSLNQGFVIDRQVLYQLNHSFPLRRANSRLRLELSCWGAEEKACQSAELEVAGGSARSGWEKALCSAAVVHPLCTAQAPAQGASGAPHVTVGASTQMSIPPTGIQPSLLGEAIPCDGHRQVQPSQHSHMDVPLFFCLPLEFC